MIEVVFGDSARGSLMQAQHYGTGAYRGSAVAVFAADSTLSADELEQAQHSADERARRAWETAIPLGGSAADVHGISLALSVDPISENGIGPQRRAVFRRLCSIWETDRTEQHIDEQLQNAAAALSAVLERSSDGEPVRIWYSHNPDELCGLYWLMAQLQPLRPHGQVSLIKLPEWEVSDNDTIVRHTGWGEIRPGEWGRYLPLQREANATFISGCAAHWRQLQEENAPLRVLLNGQLVSAPADIYDSFILREIAAQKEEFVEAHVIGAVLGTYQLGLGDAWVALRIDAMVDSGLLLPVTEAPADEPSYRRILRKAAPLEKQRPL